MSDILSQILASKEKEIAYRRARFPVKLLEDSIYFETPVASLKQYLARPDLMGVIAEIKRRSPSRGVLQSQISVEHLSIGYMQAGASALSVLTDEPFFGGSLADLREARRFNWCPILRKDFVLDEYQLVEARAAGADVVLLIARVIAPDQARALASRAKALGLEVILEVTCKEDIDRYLVPEVDHVGVNNRDLTDLSISLDRSLALAEAIPPGVMKIAESGLRSPTTVVELRCAGYSGFLIGEAFLERSRPALACAKFIQQVREEIGPVDKKIVNLGEGVLVETRRGK